MKKEFYIYYFCIDFGCSNPSFNKVGFQILL